MAPPTRLRPHLNDLLQKNLELEHVVADLRHQLTQSFAKWADERKTLAMGCDALMASFAKFRARLDVSSDWVDSEGEVEHNLDGGAQSEGAGEVDNPNGMLETEREKASSAAEDLRERCHVLAVELQVKEEELEESRRKHQAAEEELQHVQRSLETQNEQLQAAFASTQADTNNKLSPECTSDDTLAQVNSATTEPGDTFEKLALANQEINRLKKLLQQWQKYGNDWKRDAQSARLRVSELEVREMELNAQLTTAEESKALLDTERKEIQKLTSALADQTAAVEHQRAACEHSLKRVQDLEKMVSLLQARVPPEQLPWEQNATESATPRADTNTKRSDMIVLKIPHRTIRKPSGEANVPQDDQQNETHASSSIAVSPASQINNNPPSYNPTDFELCIHTCNTQPCRNESQSFLWLRKQASLPRHALSSKKHRHCSPDCPGYRLLMMPVNDAIKEPRRAKCRPPSEAELAAAEEKTRVIPSSEPTGNKGTEVERETRREGSGEPEEIEEPKDGSPQQEGDVQKTGEEESLGKSDISHLGKRHRSRLTDGEDLPQRARKRRSRASIIAKP